MNNKEKLNYMLKDLKKRNAHSSKEKIKLEKGDILAIIISATIVFLPVFLVLLAIALLAYFSLQ